MTNSHEEARAMARRMLTEGLTDDEHKWAELHRVLQQAMTKPPANLAATPDAFDAATAAVHGLKGFLGEP